MDEFKIRADNEKCLGLNYNGNGKLVMRGRNCAKFKFAKLAENKLVLSNNKQCTVHENDFNLYCKTESNSGKEIEFKGNNLLETLIDTTTALQNATKIEDTKNYMYCTKGNNGNTCYDSKNDDLVAFELKNADQYCIRTTDNKYATIEDNLVVFNTDSNSCTRFNMTIDNIDNNNPVVNSSFKVSIKQPNQPNQPNAIDSSNVCYFGKMVKDKGYSMECTNDRSILVDPRT